MKVLDVRTPSHLLENDLDESDSEPCSSSSKRAKDPEWIPESLYLQKKLQGNKTADFVAYTLRSRLVPKSGQEAEIDKEQATVVSSPEREQMTENAQGTGSPNQRKHITGHSYNLRSRFGPTDAREHE